jgi:hypothetical protein
MSIVRGYIDHVSPLVLNGAISDAAVKVLDDLLTQIERDPQNVNVWVNNAIAKLRPLPRAENIINKLQDFHPVVTKLRTPTPHQPSSHAPIYQGMQVGPHNKPKEDKPLIPIGPVHGPIGKPMYHDQNVGPDPYGNWDRAKDYGPYVVGIAALVALWQAGALAYGATQASAGLAYLLPALQVSGEAAARAPSALLLQYPGELAPTGEALAAAIQATKEALGYAQVPQMIIDSVNPQTLLDVFKTVAEPASQVAQALRPADSYTQYLIDVAKSAYPTIQNWASTIGNVHITQPVASFAQNALTQAASGEWLPSVGDALPEVNLGALFGKGKGGRRRLKGGSFGKGKHKLKLTGGQLEDIAKYLFTPDISGSHFNYLEDIKYPKHRFPQFYDTNGRLDVHKALESQFPAHIIPSRDTPIYHGLNVGPDLPSAGDDVGPSFPTDQQRFQEILQRGPPPMELEYAGAGGARVKRVKGGPLELFLGEVIANAPTQLPTPEQAARETVQLFKSHIEEILKNRPWTKTTVTEAVRVATYASGITLPGDRIGVIADYVLKPSKKNETQAVHALKNATSVAPPPPIVPAQLPADAEPAVPGDEKGLSAETGIHIPPLNAYDIGESGAVEAEIGPEQQRWVDEFLKPRSPEENRAWLDNRAIEYENEQMQKQMLDNIARDDAIVWKSTLGAPKGYAASLMDYITPKASAIDVHAPSIDNQSELIRGIHRTR